MFIVTPQPVVYRPVYLHSRPPSCARRPSFLYRQPFELEEPFVTWLIQQPVLKNDNSNDNNAASQASTEESKPRAANDASTTAGIPKANPLDTIDKPFSVQVKLPDGITSEHLQVRVENHVLHVVGKKRVVVDDFVQTTAFARQFPINDNVDTDRVSAVINPDGVLVVTAPTKTKALPSSNSATEAPNKPDDPHTTQEGNSQVAVSGTETKPAADSVQKKSVNPPFKLYISQNDKNLFAVKVELPPGVTAKDLDVQVNKGVLSISGAQSTEYNGAVLTSRFERHFALDKNAEVEKISAALDDQTRVLTVTVPKKAALEPAVQKIAIHVSGTSPISSSNDNDGGKDRPVDQVEKAEETKSLDSDSGVAVDTKAPADQSISEGDKDESWTDVENSTHLHVHAEAS